MPKNNNNTSYIVTSVMVGIVALAGLTIYLSKNQAFPAYRSQADTDLSVATTTVKIMAPLGSIQAEIATTSELRERGLSGREMMDTDNGMLFVFNIPGRYGFWMKEMNFPLDIVWIGADHRVVAINPTVANSTFPDIYFPPADISYVLEINGGESALYGIATGTLLKFVL